MANAYLCKFITDYVVLVVPTIAEDEEQAETIGLDTLSQELGITLAKYDFECELEGEYL